jgi:hypothetical protein
MMLAHSRLQNRSGGTVLLTSAQDCESGALAETLQLHQDCFGIDQRKELFASYL